MIVKKCGAKIRGCCRVGTQAKKLLVRIGPATCS